MDDATALIKHVSDWQDQWNNNNLVQFKTLYLLCFSAIVNCVLQVNGTAMPINAASFFVSSTNVMSGRLKATALSIKRVQSQ
jgi:hypothetical protein